MRRRRAAFALAGAACAAGALLSLSLGAAGLSLGEVWRAALSGPEDAAGYIFWYLRLPRTAACLLAGAALACAGCVLQGLLGNRLASPGIIGVNSGAGLAVTACCAAGALTGWTVALAAFGGALAATAAVLALARRAGASRGTVVLAGVAMNSILGAVREALTVLAPEAAMLSGEFRVGGFSSVAAARLVPAGMMICLALAAIFTLSNELDVIRLGEDAARALGMNVGRVRTALVLLAALLAGAAVSFAGLLGFVGLLAPHIARRLVGGESRFALPMSALTGAALVAVCDLISRVAFMPYELPVGILMSAIGGPFFLMLLMRGRGGGADA